MKINTTDNVVVLKSMSFYGATAGDKYVIMSNGCSNVMYLYVDSSAFSYTWNPTNILEKHFSSDEVIRFTTVVLKDEIEMIKSIKITDEEYVDVLKAFNLYPHYNLFRIEIKQNLVKKQTAYKNEDNSGEDTFYVILRNDLGLSAGTQASYVSEITTAMASELFDTHRNTEFDRFLDLTKNTVILQASGKDLFENNFIPAKYDDPKVNFTYIWDDEKRVAHGNFRLVEGKAVAMGFFGIKKDLPKFLKKLALYGE